jgi:hypothetical protein
VSNSPSVQHRLVMFTGSTSGAGKSTLSDFLSRQLVAHGVPSRWISEEDFLRMDELSEYIRLWYGGDPGVAEALLAAARTIFIGFEERDETWVTDTQFPGFFWLLGRVSMERIERFADGMAQVLLPMHPLIVYLDADIPTAFDRAVAMRGIAWGERIIDSAKDWSLPYYPHEPRSADDVFQFQIWVNKHVRRLFQSWPGEILTLDTTGSSMKETKNLLLRHFGLTETPDDSVLRGQSEEQ